jgi:4,5-dihydroxyphthalate decarboxylase
VIHAPDGRSLADMMAAGELAAGFQGNGGVGRTGAPTGAWQTVEADYPDLFPNADELEADWYERTGIYPIHGTIVVKDAVLKEHPWVATALFSAFARAKDEWLAKLDGRAPTDASDKKYLGLRQIVGHDPLPYGLEKNLATITALEQTAFKQGLTPRRLSIDELFVDPERAS